MQKLRQAGLGKQKGLHWLESSNFLIKGLQTVGVGLETGVEMRKPLEKIFKWLRGCMDCGFAE